MRSSALARAQAQLAGQRVPVKPKDSADELQEYVRAISKKSIALKLSQPSVLDLSDLSLSEPGSEKYQRTISSQQPTATQSRFLKKKVSADKNTHNAKPAGEIPKLPHPQPVPSKMPTSAALQRLAEFESRHRSRKLEIDFSENDSDLRTSEERPYSNRSSSDLSTRGNRFLKKKVNIKEPEPVDKVSVPAVKGRSPDSKTGVVESEEEEMRHLIGSSAEYSESDDRWWTNPKPPRTPSPPSKSTPRRNLHRSPSALGFISPRRPPSCLPSRSPSPPSHGTPRYPRRTRSLSGFGSQSPSPSVRSSLTNSTPRTRLGRRSRTPLSQRSDLKSLDELFSRADDPSSSSFNDFRLNIMSLDELTPAVDEHEEQKTIEKAKETKRPSTTEHKQESHHSKDESAFVRQKTSSDEDSALEVHTETSKSEASKSHRRHYSGSSENSFPEWPNDPTVHSAYSDDFEDSVPSETMQHSESNSQSYSKSVSSDSSLSTSHSHPLPRQGTQKKQTHKIQRVIVRDISVQTNNAMFTYHWPQATIGLGPIGVSTAAEPISVASHAVRPEVIEAMTTYSPAALALNDMLKQQLFLTQSFVDMARQLYFSTVQSLEGETYQYTTLEETKKYMKQQKFPG